MAKRRSSEKSKKRQGNLKDKLSPDARKRLEQAGELIGDVVDELLPPDPTFEDYENALLEISDELARGRLEKKLQSIADAQPEMLHIEHNDDWHGIGFGDFSKHKYRKHLPGTVTYHSLVGPVRVRRYTYREAARRGSTYVALDLQVGLMERMTPGLARFLACAYAQLPIRGVERLLLAAGRHPPSRATLDRSAKDIGAYAVVCNSEIEPTLRANEVLPPGTVAIALGLDRTAVAMRGVDSGFKTWPDIRRPRPKGARRNAGKGVFWRMDYVGTVTFLDADGDCLATRHYRLPSNEEPVSIADRMAADVRRALEQSPRLKVVLVQDGAPELWCLMRKRLALVPSLKGWDEVLDWYHVDERLSACLDLSTIASPHRKDQRSRWRDMLLKKTNGSDAFLKSLRNFRKRIRTEDSLKFDEHLHYFQTRTRLLGYKRIRRKRLPIGSGATEGACKSLIGCRAKRSGQHWTQRGLTAALHLRAMEQSGRFDAFWALFTQRYKATSLFPIHRRA